MRFNAKLVLLPFASIGLAGCVPVDPGLGEAVRYDMAIQTVNPDPVYPEDGAQPGGSGELGAKAVKAYRSGSTKELQIQSSTSISSSGSGSGGGGPQ